MNYKNIEKKDYKSSFEVSLDQESITKIIDQKIKNLIGVLGWELMETQNVNVFNELFA